MKRAMLTFILLALLAQQPVAAQPLPLPVANYVMNRFIAGIILQIALARGLAANAPRVVATLEAISVQSTALNVVSTGAGIGLSLAGAPVWLTILAGLGIVGATSSLVAKMGQAEVMLAQAYDGTITMVSKLPREHPETLPAYPEFETTPSDEFLFEKLRSLGANVYRTSNCSAANTLVACHQFPRMPDISTGIALAYPEYAIRIPFQSISELELLRTRWIFGSGEPDPQLKIIETFDADGEFAGFAERMWTNKHHFCKKDASSPCPGKFEWVTLKLDPRAFQIDREAFYGLSRTIKRYPDLDAALADMSPNILSMPISANTLAEIVDEVWQRAAEEPDYKGLPYRELEPVTEEDIVIWIKKNPREVPDIEDVLKPAKKPDEKKVTISPRIRPKENPAPQTKPEVDPQTKPVTAKDPNTARDPDTKTEPDADSNKNTDVVQDVNVINRPTVDIGNRVKVDIDLGTPPETDRPKLEEAPTATKILDPILDLIPDFKTWTTPPHSAACPSATFQVFDHVIPLDAHCTIAERIGPQLRGAMLAAFAILTILIVLSA